MQETGGTVETEIVLHVKFKTESRESNVFQVEDLLYKDDEEALDGAIDALVNIFEWSEDSKTADGIFKRVVVVKQTITEKYDVLEEP